MAILDELEKILEKDASLLRNLSETIWNHPEVGFHETFACATTVDLLRSFGYDVTTPFCELDTAFKAQFRNGDGPTIAFCSEYDALVGIGHACGHNLICTGGVAAFLATAQYMKAHDVRGRVVLLGTPAEESYGGKVKMEEAGCLEVIEAVLMAHPEAQNRIDNGSSAVIGYEVCFHGKAAHAGACPEKGINALDAVNLLFCAINAFRQQMPDSARIHGIITNGGALPNSIPDKTSCRIYLRSTVEKELDQLVERFLDMIRGAELMTHAKAEVSVFHQRYRANKPNVAFNDEYIRLMNAQGEKVSVPSEPTRASTDFGNFSQKIPGCHFYFAVAEKGELPGHSVEMREACKGDYAFDRMLMASAAMANMAVEFLSNEEFRVKVIDDFKKN
ncbi:MAG: M20 family metallopeptidase [Lentisphaeria bacterium]|nr:M20 family metallopeptidase [Lentisphaeria bacterium]